MTTPSLRGLTRFSDNEGDIIWPAWRAELKQRVAFEFGKIGNQIIEGEVKESDVDLGEVTEKINALINALIPRTRAQIQTRSDWMEEFVVSSEEGASDEVCSIKKTKLTLIGKMSVVSAISRIKSSYFESIQEHGLVRGSKVAKDLAKKKLNYVDTTLPQWLVKMDRHGQVRSAKHQRCAKCTRCKMRKTMLGNTRDVSVCVSCKFENSKLVFESRWWASGGETGKLF